MSQRSDPFLLRGGLDLVTPALAVQPGRAITAVNYWPTDRGYERMAGYERFDGGPAPSDAWFDLVRFRSRTAPILQGATVTGSESGASGEVIAVVDDEAGPFLASDAEVSCGSITYLTTTPDRLEVTSGYAIVADTSDEFEVAEGLNVSAVQVATVESVASRNSAPTVEQEQEYLAAAADLRRTLVTPVPGIGPVRGGAIHRNEIYAFRNIDETECGMYKATPDGWALQDLGSTIEFTAGTAEFFEGQTLTRGITATIRRVVVTSGTWAGNNAAGYMVLYDVTGTFSSGTGTSASGSATFSTAPVANTIPAAYGGNQISIAEYDFGPGARLYVAPGRGRAFEWNGFNGVFTPIRAPMGEDRPVLVKAFRQHLFLFYTGTMLFSEIGNPYLWGTTGGAGEIKLGDFPRAALESAETAMLIVGLNKVWYLTGSDAETFVLEELTDEAGGGLNTAHNVGRPIYTDRRGIREFTATDTTAGFSMGTISGSITPLFEIAERATLIPWAAAVSANRSHYYLWYADMQNRDAADFASSEAVRQTVMASFMAGREAEVTQIEMPHVVWSAWGGLIRARESIFIGCLDGYVRQWDRGTSFDGEKITAYIRLPFNMVRMPAAKKRYHSVEFEVEASGAHNLAIAADFNYGDGSRPARSDQSGLVIGGGGYWDEDTWGEFNWSAPVNGMIRKRLDGVGRSCSVSIASDSKSEPSHILTAAHVHWSQRGYIR